MNPIHLSAWDVGLAAVSVLANAAASLALGLRLHWPMLWSAVRMVAQLVLVGLLLRVVFHAASPWITAGLCLLMVVATVREAAARPGARLRRGGNFRISVWAVSLSSIATVVLALLTAIRPEPWFDPRFAIPLMGMVLGTVLNAVSLGLKDFLDGLRQGRAGIEARLALGETSGQALAPLVRASVHKAMIPLFNQMSAAGIITLPGAMTGQLLAGMDPMEAVKYQIMLMLWLSGAGAAAAMATVHLAARAMVDERQRLRLDHLV